MPKALSSLLKEPEIERLMADALLERLTAAGAPQPKQSAAKKGLRGRNVNAVKAKRFKAIVRKAVRDVFEGVSNSQRLDPAAVRLLAAVAPGAVAAPGARGQFWRVPTW